MRSPGFRQRALVEGGWTVEGGASITTYFVGACLYYFPNEFRRHRTSEENQRRALHSSQYGNEIMPSTEAEVLGRERLRETIENIDPRKVRERAVVALTLEGYTQEEISHLLGEDSVRAIEGVVHRWRRRPRRGN
ncbi:sigma-70 family RNA polymerase sigma factor [Streptomyces agglomeratus]|uniref:sigma-70 family RNA polymerase sigma factor n=1 Tax=Streptomyces agglomeratus TaxID=285458 RepID=UPI0008544BFD|nr:sigma-70 family RNA polymerase sigma factor [Streptomyces agglomeratus]OEJ36532.1 hypothetical protein BGK72_38200 [Streptomyces agglomeratus]